MHETDQLYQEIFRDYRGKGWTCWCGHFHSKARGNKSRNGALEKSNGWKGGKILSNGYIYVLMANHPAGVRNGRGYVPEHILMAELSIGRFLEPGEIVHHINRDTMDNRPENLYVCISRFHHLTIHRILNALDACGHPHWLRCSYCGKYDAPEHLRRYTHKTGTRHCQHHIECHRAHARAKWIPRKQRMKLLVD